jgi:hypothetical protein
MKSFKEFLNESVSLSEASIKDVDVVDPKDSTYKKLLKKHNVSAKLERQNGPSGYPTFTFTAKVKQDLLDFLSAVGYADLEDDVK